MESNSTPATRKPGQCAGDECCACFHMLNFHFALVRNICVLCQACVSAAPVGLAVALGEPLEPRALCCTLL